MTEERRLYPRATRDPLSATTRSVARWMFYGHLWLGVITATVVVVLSISGILLNHKRPLGLMPDVPHSPTGVFDAALPMAELVRRADVEAPEAAAAGVDRLDVRPSDGYMKVRYADDDVTEVTIDINTGQVLHVGLRNDVFLEKLHSGEIFGSNWVLLSDIAAITLIVLVVTGFWLWLFPRTRM